MLKAFKEARFYASLLFVCLTAHMAWAQLNYGPVSAYSSGEMLEQVRKLQVLGKVLYVAAHPDDENTRMLAWLARDQKFETAYLSLTRGDGGQNLIGKEVREGLGLIRTQELLAARRIDGARQFFSRANDFGYSKTPDETFTKWDYDSLLSDVVWVIRRFRPDVIITRFSPTPSPTHGHHTASAQLAMAAFEAAADPNRFAWQLQYVEVWQAQRVYWNTSWWFYGRQDYDKKGLLSVDVGSYNAVLGTGYGEIAAASRSLHKSQGFGASRQRGSELEYLQLLAGKGGKTDLMEGVKYDWTRIKGTRAIRDALQQAERSFDATAPWKMLPWLVQAAEALAKLPETDGEMRHWKQLKSTHLQQLIAVTAGIWNDFLALQPQAVPGDSVTFQLRSIVRHPVKVALERLDIDRLTYEPKLDAPYQYVQQLSLNKRFDLPDNRLEQLDLRLSIAENQPLSNPFWLNGQLQHGFFDLPDPRWVGWSENPAPFRARARYLLRVGEKEYRLELKFPVYYRYTDPADGEKYQPLEILPALQLGFADKVYISTGQKVKAEVVVKASATTAGAKLFLELPDGWTSEPAFHQLSEAQSGAEYRFAFEIFPAKQASSGPMRAVASTPDGRFYNRSLIRISYPHIPVQTQLAEATAQLLVLEVQRQKTRIGYLPGAGDEIPEALTALGYKVDVLPTQQLSPELLSQYQTIVAGVRLANTEAALEAKIPMLMAYVAQGGTLVMQYNTSQSLLTKQLGPYLLTLGRGRVTVEEAPVSLIQSNHPLLSQPNRITEADFNNWVQERGLYFAAEWDSAYVPLLRMNDPGELPLDGALLYARHGKGVYIYSALSWFRQLPAGVPGAYRLWMNLIEAK